MVMHTPTRVLVFVTVPMAVAALGLASWHLWRMPDPPGSQPNKQVAASDHRGVPEVPAIAIDPEALATATAPRTGEGHSKAVSELVELAKTRQPLTPSDAQTLLAFIAAPKPDGLTGGEWEERVNVILNLLRQQASVPGLTDYLVATAEKHPSKVLRLYAMQHLSLWFATESDAEKRRAMVKLLEDLASRPGDETAGCAVLMLADMLRAVAAGDDHRSLSVDVEVRRAKSSDSNRPPLLPSDIDWNAIDKLVGRESARLIGDGKAAQDVRISAIHACVGRNDAAPLPELRKIAADPALMSTLRKAAIHAIGQLGGVEDVALLDSLPQDDRNLSMAVQPARKALVTRNTGGN